MLTKKGLEFLLRITDYFGGHWEDPGWGQRPMSQILVNLSLHQLAEGIADDEARAQVQRIAEKEIAGAAQVILRRAS